MQHCLPYIVATGKSSINTSEMIISALIKILGKRLQDDLPVDRLITVYFSIYLCIGSVLIMYSNKFVFFSYFGSLSTHPDFLDNETVITNLSESYRLLILHDFWRIKIFLIGYDFQSCINDYSSLAQTLIYLYDGKSLLRP